MRQPVDSDLAHLVVADGKPERDLELVIVEFLNGTAPNQRHVGLKNGVLNSLWTKLGLLVADRTSGC